MGSKGIARQMLARRPGRSSEIDPGQVHPPAREKTQVRGKVEIAIYDRLVVSQGLPRKRKSGFLAHTDTGSARPAPDNDRKAAAVQAGNAPFSRNFVIGKSGIMSIPGS